MARTSVAVILGIVMLFVGFQALGLQSQSVKPDMNNSTNFTSDTYNATNEIFQGISTAAVPALVWMGMGAIVVLAGAYLVYIGPGGR